MPKILPIDYQILKLIIQEAYSCNGNIFPKWEWLKFNKDLTFTLLVYHYELNDVLDLRYGNYWCSA
jgi:hypothetical protein